MPAAPVRLNSPGSGATPDGLSCRLGVIRKHARPVSGRGWFETIRRLLAGLAKLADAPSLEVGAERHGGSNPSPGTRGTAVMVSPLALEARMSKFESWVPHHILAGPSSNGRILGCEPRETRSTRVGPSKNNA
jgi:hypothetical protein